MISPLNDIIKSKSSNGSNIRPHPLLCTLYLIALSYGTYECLLKKAL